MCTCDSGFTGDGMNCTGMDDIKILLRYRIDFSEKVILIKQSTFQLQRLPHPIKYNFYCECKLQY